MIGRIEVRPIPHLIPAFFATGVSLSPVARILLFVQLPAAITGKDKAVLFGLVQIIAVPRAIGVLIPPFQSPGVFRLLLLKLSFTEVASQG